MLGCPVAKHLWTPSSLSFPLVLPLSQAGPKRKNRPHIHTQAYTGTHTWFYARGCINMNQGWQCRAEWSPVHPIFIIYLRLNGFGALLDGSPLTLIYLLKCEKWYISKLNLTHTNFPSLQYSLPVTQGLFVKSGTERNVNTVVWFHTDRGGWRAGVVLAHEGKKNQLLLHRVKDVNLF